MELEERRPPFTELVEHGLLGGIPCRTNMDEFALVNTSSGVFDPKIAEMEMARMCEYSVA